VSITVAPYLESRLITVLCQQFVLYLRKRDPRWLPNFQTDEERHAAARSAAKDQSVRARSENAAKMAKYKEAEWTKVDDIANIDSATASEDEENRIEVEYECVACRKKFKNEKQIEMHEKSKKHIKIVQSLRRRMREEAKSLGLDEETEEEESHDVELTGLEKQDVSDLEDESRNKNSNVSSYHRTVHGSGEQDAEPRNDENLNHGFAKLDLTSPLPEGDENTSEGSPDRGSQSEMSRETLPGGEIPQAGKKKKPRRRVKTFEKNSQVCFADTN
jgi:hypothetical protein